MDSHDAFQFGAKLEEQIAQAYDNGYKKGYAAAQQLFLNSRTYAESKDNRP